MHDHPRIAAVTFMGTPAEGSLRLNQVLLLLLHVFGIFSFHLSALASMLSATADLGMVAPFQ